jgi:hypothetical protein
MDIVEHSTDWIEFDAENDEVPFLHMHDMIEVKYINGYQSPPVPAWSVDFDGSRYPVTAYRVIKKAEASEIEQLRKDKQLGFELMDVFIIRIHRLRQSLYRIANIENDPEFGLPPITNSIKIAQDALEEE